MRYKILTFTSTASLEYIIGLYNYASIISKSKLSVYTALCKAIVVYLYIYMQINISYFTSQAQFNNNMSY